MRPPQGPLMGRHHYSAGYSSASCLTRKAGTCSTLFMHMYLVHTSCEIHQVTSKLGVLKSMPGQAHPEEKFAGINAHSLCMGLSSLISQTIAPIWAARTIAQPDPQDRLPDLDLCSTLKLITGEQSHLLPLLCLQVHKNCCRRMRPPYRPRHDCNGNSDSE